MKGMEKLNSKKLAGIAETALDDMKGQSIKIIDVRKLTEITDYMVIATGRSNTHIKALSNEVVEKIEEAGGKIVGVEGKLQSEWVLVDAGDVVVHIMTAPVRALYNLEDLWSFQANTQAAEDKAGEE